MNILLLSMPDSFEHMPVAFAHDPIFVLRNARKMTAFTFRGSTIKSLLGLEDEIKAFKRYRAIRDSDGVYLRVLEWIDKHKRRPV